MRNLLPALALLPVVLHAQTELPPPKEEAPITRPNTVDQMPEFPGGEEAMMAWFAEHITYPEAERAAGVEGKVVVRFTVDTTGAVIDVSTVRGPTRPVNAEAERVVNAMPKWKPGMRAGKPVPAQLTVPVQFKLAAGKEKP